MRARLAAHAMHAKYDSRAVSKPGRDAFLARFETEVDPDGALDPVERARRADHARKAYFTKLAYKSAQARRHRAVGEVEAREEFGTPALPEPPKRRRRRVVRREALS